MERTPPHNLEAEQACLGSCFISADAVPEVIEILDSSDFYRPAHQRIMRAIELLHAKGEPVDAITAAEQLEGAGHLEDVGGKPYLLTVTNSIPVASNVCNYATIVRNCSKLRSLIRIATSSVTLGYSTPEDADEAIGRALNLIASLAASTASDGVPIDKAVDMLLKEVGMGRVDYVSPPHFPGIHIRNGELVVVAAGTSIGKTAVALDWADAWSKVHHVAFYEYEMNEVSLVSRMVSKYAGISVPEMEEGLDDQQKKWLELGADEVRTRRLTVEAVHGNIDVLIAKIRKFAGRGGEIAFIDHLGLVPFDIPKGTNHAKAVGSQVTNRLKRLSMELGIVIVLLCQLNREGQRGFGPNKYPGLMALRDSGEIEQDADKVLTLYRFRRYEEDRSEWTSVREKHELSTDSKWGDRYEILHFEWAKYRNGPTFGSDLIFIGDRCEFLRPEQENLVPYSVQEVITEIVEGGEQCAMELPV